MTILKKTNNKNSHKQEILFKFVSFFLMLGWICFIFSLSLQPASQSSAVSRGLLTNILEFFYSLTNIRIDVLTFHNIFRTLAHFTEFFILGILSILFYFSAMKKRPVYAVITGFIVAICDELIQYFFADGRAMQIEDIAVDFLGIIFSTIIYFIFYKIYLNKKYAKKLNK